MRVKTTAKVITAFVYDKKDKETKELTGQKGLMISLLIDERDGKELSGKVITPFVNQDYCGTYNFDDVNRLDTVYVDLDVPSGKGLYVLYDLSIEQI